MPTPSGVLLIDKPSGVTSHDVVAAVRRLAGTRKVGHAGTLDPMATGLLTVGIGAGTRLLTYFSGQAKSYEATIRLGAATSTEDADGELALDTIGVCPDFDVADFDAALAGLTGDIMQRPSAVSAIKIDGERAYDRVRAGEQVELAARPVTVHSFIRLGEPRASQIEFRPRNYIPVIEVDVAASVSAGTYIRALGRDVGAALSMGAHLSKLRRIQVGDFKVGQAATMPELIKLVRAGEPLPIMPLAQAAAKVMPALGVTAEQATKLRQGQFIELETQPSSYPVALIAAAGGEANIELVAIAKARGRLTAPATVFAHE